MAEYLIMDDDRAFPQGQIVEAPNMKAAVSQIVETTGGSTLQIYRIASGPVEVRVREETNTVFDFGTPTNEEE